jgi:hypothetical protein
MVFPFFDLVHESEYVKLTPLAMTLKHEPKPK